MNDDHFERYLKKFSVPPPPALEQSIFGTKRRRWPMYMATAAAVIGLILFIGWPQQTSVDTPNVAKSLPAQLTRMHMRRMALSDPEAFDAFLDQSATKILTLSQPNQTLSMATLHLPDNS